MAKKKIETKRGKRRKTNKIALKKIKETGSERKGAKDKVRKVRTTNEKFFEERRKLQ